MLLWDYLYCLSNLIVILGLVYYNVDTLLCCFSTKKIAGYTSKHAYEVFLISENPDL